MGGRGPRRTPWPLLYLLNIRCTRTGPLLILSMKLRMQPAVVVVAVERTDCTRRHNYKVTSAPPSRLSLNLWRIGWHNAKELPQIHRWRQRRRNHSKLLACFPLNAIMAAINVSHVDYLSLDVEGAEIEILRTIEWTQLQIDVITVEYLILRNPEATLKKKLKELRQLLNDTGMYQEKGILPRRDLLHRSNDVVYMRI